MEKKHGKPVPNTSCACCWEDLDDSCYVEYLSSADSNWLPSGFCQNCIQHLLDTQWNTYVTALAHTKCRAEQRRLLAKGPPINLSDKTALPCPDDGEVYSLWYISDGAEHSAKLNGSLLGEERKKYWDEQSSFYIKDEHVDEGEEGHAEEAK